MKKEKLRFIAYDAANGEYEWFATKKEAEDWLTEDDGDGISQEAECGQNVIAEIQYQSVVTITDSKENYHVHTGECPEDCDEEEWPHSSDFDWVGSHTYEKSTGMRRSNATNDHYPEYVMFVNKNKKHSAMKLINTDANPSEYPAQYSLGETELIFEASFSSSWELILTDNNPIHIVGKKLVQVSLKEFISDQNKQ